MTTQRIDTSNVTYQDLLDHPELLERLERQARAERAVVVGELMLSPLSRLLGRETDEPAGVPAAARG
jgi:hypothetical protein